MGRNMKQNLIIILGLSLALGACATKPKKTESAEPGAAARSMATDRETASQVLLAATTATREAEAVVRETETSLNESGAMNRTGPSDRSNTAREQGGNQGDPMDPGSAGASRPETNGRDPAGAPDRRGERGEKPGSAGREGGTQSGSGDQSGSNRTDSDLNDLSGNSSGGSQEAVQGRAPTAEVVDQGQDAPGNQNADRGRGATMEESDMNPRTDGSDPDSRARTRRNNSKSSDSRENLAEGNLDREIQEAERQALLAARAAESVEAESARSGRDSSDPSASSGRDTGRNASERPTRATEAGDPGRDNAKSTAEAASRRDNSARRASNPGTREEEKSTAAEKPDASGDPAADTAARTSAGRDRRTRKNVESATGPGDGARKVEREDSANLRLNEEGTFTDTRGRAISPETAAREEKTQSGMIAADTYQVFVTVFGNSKDEAMQQGKVDAKLKAYNLLLKEHRSGNRLSERGRRDLRQFIDRNGEVTDVTRNSENSWNVTMQIKNPSLQSFLKKLR